MSRIIRCPNCYDDITENECYEDKLPGRLSGYLNVSYVCFKCKLEVYTYKVEEYYTDDEPLEEYNI